MAFEMLTMNIPISTSAYTFTFTNPIQQYVAGISGFCLGYGSGNYFNFQTLSVTLNVTSVSGNSITIKPLFILTDGTGNYPGSDCNVTITVLAYTGSVNNSNLLLLSNIPNNTTIPLPSAPLTVIPILCGFSLNFADNLNHNLSMLELGTGLIQNNYNVAVNGYAWLNDITNHYANPAILSGLIINCDPGLSLWCQSLPSTNTNNVNGITVENNFQGTFLAGFNMYLTAGDFPISELGAQSNIGSSSNIICGHSWCWYNQSSHLFTTNTVDVVAIGFS